MSPRRLDPGCRGRARYLLARISLTRSDSSYESVPLRLAVLQDQARGECARACVHAREYSRVQSSEERVGLAPPRALRYSKMQYPKIYFADGERQVCAEMSRRSADQSEQFIPLYRRRDKMPAWTE